jgi:hypothetical protein
MKTKKFERWHRFDANNVKQIKNFPLNSEQPPTDDNYTPWIKGTGKLSPEQYAIVSTAVRKANTGIVRSAETLERMSKAQMGVPKTEEQKLKMSLAKKGVPKTEEHKQNMRLAQLARIRRLKGLE